MALTIGNWIFISLIFLGGIIALIYFHLDGANKSTMLLIGVLTIALCLGAMFGLSWYHKNTAKGARAYKDFESNLQNGLEREITIYAEDGREIFHYEGKVDIETNHDGNANYILFESETGQRYIIYYGIQDTVLIIEKAE